MSVKWTDQDIKPAGGSNRPPQSDPLAPTIYQLRQRPGVWAELNRYPIARLQSARSRGSQIKKRHPGIEYAVLPEADTAVLYLRAAVETGDE